MKIFITALSLFLFPLSYSLGSDILFFEDPEPQVPIRTDAEGEDREILEGTNLKHGDLSKKREVRQNQEETDPIFYDSTTSPAEMKSH